VFWCSSLGDALALCIQNLEPGKDVEFVNLTDPVYYVKIHHWHPRIEHTNNTLDPRHGPTLELTHVGLNADTQFTHTHLHKCDRAHLAVRLSALPPCALVHTSAPSHSVPICASAIERTYRYDRAPLFRGLI
jgi:hypothetical protein